VLFIIFTSGQLGVCLLAPACHLASVQATLCIIYTNITCSMSSGV